MLDEIAQGSIFFNGLLLKQRFKLFRDLDADHNFCHAPF
jgi:hypothetical protein